jgi:hypothetical protein
VQIKEIISVARQKTYVAVNFAQIEANWLIGQKIVEQEQYGKKRAEYGKYVIKLASQELTKEFGKGFSERNLENFRRFYLMFNNVLIPQTLSAESNLLTWSHYERLMRVEDVKARNWYLKEAAEQMWSVRILDRNISTLYYHRLLSSQIKEPVIQEMQEKTKIFQQDKLEFIKNSSDNPTIGILLCTETDNTIARYSVLKENRQLFASKYMPCLPTEAELKAEIERQKEIFAMANLKRKRRSKNLEILKMREK